MKCKFLLILNMFVAIFTWKNSSSFGLVVPASLEFQRQLVSQERSRFFYSAICILWKTIALF
jgi:hypothetical protein